MSKFLSDLDVKVLNDKDWELCSPFSYKSSLLKRTLTVPKGFKTDFASFRIGPFQLDVGRKAAVIHDYAYRTKGVLPKILADLIFLEAMKLSGVQFYRRWYMFLAVVLFGFSSYKGGKW